MLNKHTVFKSKQESYIENMVEQIIAGDNPDEMYWIQDDDEGGLSWSPGRVVEVRKTSYVLECIVSGDHFEIDKDDPAVVHPTCLGK